jgi:hypothetical protein
MNQLEEKLNIFDVQKTKIVYLKKELEKITKTAKK